MEYLEKSIGVEYWHQDEIVRLDRKLYRMKDSCDLYRMHREKKGKGSDDAEIDVIRERLSDSGYVYLKGLFSRKDVMRAGSLVAEFHKTCGSGTKGVTYTGCEEVTHDPSLLKLLEGSALSSFASNIFGEPACTFRTKWLRAVAPGENTTAHSDAFFFNSTVNHSMLTAWIPLQDTPLRKGPLAVCERSHRLEKFDRDGRRRMDDEMPSDFHEFSNTLIWRTADFEAGDLLVFDERTIHASLPNTATSFRFSVDTRWQPKRFFKGERPSGASKSRGDGECTYPHRGGK